MAWFEEMFAGGVIPAMERALAFASARHRLLLTNIANADTPGYRRNDLEPASFRETLGTLERTGGASGTGPLRHDGNDVDLETELARLAENGIFHNQMAGLLRKALEQIRAAAAERSSAG